jgi:hypothetical protein
MSYIETAKRPSRDLDVSIAEACGAEAGFVGKIGYKMRNAPWRDYDTSHWQTLPHFSSSVDDALRLIPRDWHLVELRHLSPNDWYAKIADRFNDHYETEGEHKTPAMALCVAIVRSTCVAQLRVRADREDEVVY